MIIRLNVWSMRPECLSPVFRSRIGPFAALGLAGLVACWLWGQEPVCRFLLPLEQAEANTILTALESYRLDVGRYPTTQDGLIVLWRSPGVLGWSGPYLPADRMSLLDRFVYCFPGSRQDTRPELHIRRPIVEEAPAELKLRAE